MMRVFFIKLNFSFSYSQQRLKKIKRLIRKHDKSIDIINRKEAFKKIMNNSMKEIDNDSENELGTNLQLMKMNYE